MKNKYPYLIIGVFLLVIILTLISYFYFPKEESEIVKQEVAEEISNDFYVDVKGAVKTEYMNLSVVIE